MVALNVRLYEMVAHQVTLRLGRHECVGKDMRKVVTF